jgi:beta-lactamase superfamily II metal-dependent hydrolase
MPTFSRRNIAANRVAKMGTVKLIVVASAEAGAKDMELVLVRDDRRPTLAAPHDQKADQRHGDQLAVEQAFGDMHALLTGQFDKGKHDREREHRCQTRENSCHRPVLSGGAVIAHAILP